MSLPFDQTSDLGKHFHDENKQHSAEHQNWKRGDLLTLFWVDLYLMIFLEYLYLMMMSPSFQQFSHFLQMPGYTRQGMDTPGITITIASMQKCFCVQHFNFYHHQYSYNDFHLKKRTLSDTFSLSHFKTE